MGRVGEGCAEYGYEQRKLVLSTVGSTDYFPIDTTAAAGTAGGTVLYSPPPLLLPRPAPELCVLVHSTPALGEASMFSGGDSTVIKADGRRCRRYLT